jgi:hypothetical protein
MRIVQSANRVSLAKHSDEIVTAWIGYLVGYQLTNIYRIWIPSRNKVICSCDVIFDEGTTFDSNIKTMQDDLLYMDQEEFVELIN